MTQPSILYAIDPGKTGALARFVGGRLAGIADPVSGSLAPVLAARMLDDLGEARAAVTVVIEKVQGVPGQGGPASFNFGKGFGELLGVCLGLGVEPELIPPNVWKPALGLKRVHGVKESAWKALSLNMARELWPDVTWFRMAKDDGRAEAALLGHYALTQRLFI